MCFVIHVRTQDEESPSVFTLPSYVYAVEGKGTWRMHTRIAVGQHLEVTNIASLLSYCLELRLIASLHCGRVGNASGWVSNEGC